MKPLPLLRGIFSEDKNQQDLLSSYFDRTEVHKDIPSSIVLGDESKAFAFVEPLNASSIDGCYTGDLEAGEDEAKFHIAVGE